jgi:hypothetical protein
MLEGKVDSVNEVGFHPSPDDVVLQPELLERTPQVISEGPGRQMEEADGVGGCDGLVGEVRVTVVGRSGLFRLRACAICVLFVSND